MTTSPKDALAELDRITQSLDIYDCATRRSLQVIRTKLSALVEAAKFAQKALKNGNVWDSTVAETMLDEALRELGR